MMIRRLAVFTALAVLSSCNVCEDEGCENGVRVNASQGGAELAPGQYRVTVDADGETRFCELTLADGEICVSGVLSVLASTTGLAIHVAATPAQLAVQVSRDGAPAGSASYDLEYETRHVDNGGGDCDMHCEFAGEHELSLTPP